MQACDPGVYGDKLTYRREADEADGTGFVLCAKHAACKLEDVLNGCWSGTGDARPDLVVDREASGRVGIVSGALHLSSRRLEIVGFTDVNAEVDQSHRQSVAIVAIDAAGTAQ